jgi:hypothetical protein
MTLLSVLFSSERWFVIREHTEEEGTSALAVGSAEREGEALWHGAIRAWMGRPGARCVCPHGLLRGFAVGVWPHGFMAILAINKERNQADGEEQRVSCGRDTGALASPSASDHLYYPLSKALGINAPKSLSYPCDLLKTERQSLSSCPVYPPPPFHCSVPIT